MGFFSTVHIPKTTLPQRRETANTIKPQAQKDVFCPNCGSKYVEGKNFCVECGQTRIKKYTSKLPAEKMYAIDLAEYLRNWLAENPYLYNIKLNCRLDFMPNDFNRIKQVFVREAEVSYSVADNPVNVQYGVEYLYEYKASLNVFKQNEVTSDYLVEEWKKNNPQYKVNHYICGRTRSNDGIYQYYCIVIFEKNL